MFPARFMGVLAFVFTAAAYACPLCHTQTGEQVRAGIFNSAFGLNLLATALPFPIFAGLVVWVYRSKPRQSERSLRERESCGVEGARDRGVSQQEQE